jgi:hypothetical protein
MANYLLFIAVFVLTFVTKVEAQNGTPTPCATNPPDFSKMSYKEADEASFSEAEKVTCPEYVTNLLNQLRSGRLNEDNKALAIDLLGKLHPNDLNAVEFLIENVDFKRKKFDLPTRISTQLKYPAEGALMLMGQPVIDPILNHLGNETNTLRCHLLCEALAFVDKPKNDNASVGKAIALQQVQQKLATIQTNLEAALIELKK